MPDDIKPVENIEDAWKNPSEAKIPLQYFEDVVPYDPGGDLIENLIQPSSLALIAGLSASRKTFLALDIGMAVARSVAFFGRTVRGGPVIYIAAEAGKSFDNRVCAYRKFHYLENTNIQFASISVPVNLKSQNGDTSDLIETIRQAGEKFGIPPVLVEIDTLAAVAAGFDENSSADMTSLIGNLQRIRDETGAAVLAVHHHGKDTSKGARGHSSLFAAMDTEITVTAKGDYSVASVSKQRDLEGTGEISFSLEVIEIATRQNGKPLTSCVVVPSDAQASPKKAKTLTGAKRIAMDALDDILIRNGKRIIGDYGIPAGANCADFKQWRTEFYARKPDTNQSAKNKAFNRALRSLRDGSLIGCRNEQVWKVTDVRDQ